jgi:hypothetical protein
MDQAELVLLVEQQEGGRQRLLSMQEALHMMVGGLPRVLMVSSSRKLQVRPWLLASLRGCNAWCTIDMRQHRTLPTATCSVSWLLHCVGGRSISRSQTRCVVHGTFFNVMWLRHMAAGVTRCEPGSPAAAESPEAHWLPCQEVGEAKGSYTSSYESIH